MIYGSNFLEVFVCHSLDALITNIFTFEIRNLIGVAAEYACASRLIFAEHDAVAVNIDLESVFFFDGKRTAQFDRNNNATQFINFSWNSKPTKQQNSSKQ